METFGRAKKANGKWIFGIELKDNIMAGQFLYMKIPYY